MNRLLAVILVPATVAALAVGLVLLARKDEKPEDPIERGMEALMRRADDWDRELEPWQEVPIPLPSGVPTVTFLRRHAHPFLAEYDRKLRIGVEAMVDLPTNVGGRTLTNIFLIREGDGRGPILHLCDHWGHCFVDLVEARTVEARADPPGEYVGRLDGSDYPLRFVPASEAGPAAIRPMFEE